VKALVGVDIGGTKTAVVLGRLTSREPEILGRQAFATEHGEGYAPVVDRICTTTRDLLSSHSIPHADLSGIGISCGGPLDSRKGLVLSPPNLPGWDRVPVAELLSRSLGAPARLQNDANACAVAEWRFGAGRGCRSMVFLTFGTGIGAGLILDGRLYEGPTDLAGEVGHLRLAEDGPEGYGKRGSFEGFCSGGGIARLARAEAERRIAAGDAAAFCPDRAGLDGITAQAVAEAAARGDPAARGVLVESGRWLGRGLALIVDLLNPERIVIGSIYVRCRQFLEPAMRGELAREALGLSVAACEVVPAGLGEAIGDYASLTVAMAAAGRESGAQGAVQRPRTAAASREAGRESGAQGAVQRPAQGEG
jgi:glucokinase